MAACERTLRKHTECVRGLLRNGNRSDGDHEPCRDTGQAYIACRHGQKPPVESEVVHLGSTETEPMGFFTKQLVSGPISKSHVPEGELPSLLGSRSGPPPCDKELSIYGTCIENYFRNATAKVANYSMLSHDAEAKCSNSRRSFEICRAENRAIMEGRKKDDQNVEPWQSKKVAEHFSSSGNI